ncbi:alpha/beta hydrolase [Candidatus Pelagibacter bacterium]|nr:alpha/beta hydrolase [Candidatus Pelagibacter bacterium]
MKYLYLAVSSVVLAYFIIILFVYFYQRNLLYHPSENNYLNDKITFNYEEIFIETNKKIKLKSWFIKKDLDKFKTILIFHGNAGNLFNRVYKLNELNKLNVNILLISWRGFSGNKGKPTEKNLYRDADESVKWLNNQGVISKNIILYGESLGTGVATELGTSNAFGGIILESPFTSIANAAKIYYPYLPVSIILKDRYDSIGKIKNINTPIFIMHGKMDNIVPQQMGLELFEKANNPKYSYFPEDDDHMMNYNKQLLNEIKLFINKI